MRIGCCAVATVPSTSQHLSTVVGAVVRLFHAVMVSVVVDLLAGLLLSPRPTPGDALPRFAWPIFVP